MRSVVRVLTLISLATAVGGCWRYGEGAQYIQRSDTITLSAGNAKEVNAATQITDPWPRHAAKRRIPANGARMVGAVERYQGKQGQRGQGGQGGASAIVSSPSDVAPSGPPGPPLGVALPTSR